MKENFTKVVMMTSDKKFAEYIAKAFLDNVVLKTIGDKEAYLGFYKNREIGVIASEIGITNTGILAYELYNFYGVEVVIKIDSCKAYSPNVDLQELIFVNEVYTNSDYGKINFSLDQHLMMPNELLLKLRVAADNLELRHNEGVIVSCDGDFNKDFEDEMMEKGMMAKDYETYGLFANALIANKQAITVLVVTEHHFLEEKIFKKVGIFREAIELILNVNY